MRQTRLLFFTAALAACFAACKSSTETPQPFTWSPGATYHIVPPSDTLPHGHTWADWQTLWWEWVESMDSNHHALRDNAPASTNQLGHGHDSVWFGGGNYWPVGSLGRLDTVRTLTLPFGTAFYFPILNYEDDLATDPADSNSDSRMVMLMRQSWEPASGTAYLAYNGNPELIAEIDGNPVQNFDLYYSYQPAPFRCYLVDGNVDDGIAGYTDMLSAGIYLMLDSLSRGNHVVYFKVGSNPPINVTYDVTVQ